MLRHLLLLLSLSLCLGEGSPAFAQDFEPKALYLTVFTHDDWQNRPEENLAVEHTYSDVLAKLRENAHVSHVKYGSDIFNGRDFKISESQLPVIRLQFSTGGLIKGFQGGEIPSSASALHASFKEHYEAAIELQTAETAVIEEPIYEGRILDLFRNRDGPERQGLFKDKPIRTTIAWGTYLVIGACVLAVLMVMLFISSPFIICLCYFIAMILRNKKQPEK